MKATDVTELLRLAEVPAARMVHAAIVHARAKHPGATIDTLPLHHRVSVLAEEVGEVARGVQNVAGSDAAIPRQELRAELAQVAACALMWLEDELRAAGWT